MGWECRHRQWRRSVDRQWLRSIAISVGNEGCQLQYPSAMETVYCRPTEAVYRNIRRQWRRCFVLQWVWSRALRWRLSITISVGNGGGVLDSNEGGISHCNGVCDLQYQLRTEAVNCNMRRVWRRWIALQCMESIDRQWRRSIAISVGNGGIPMHGIDGSPMDTAYCNIRRR